MSDDTIQNIIILKKSHVFGRAHWLYQLRRLHIKPNQNKSYQMVFSETGNSTAEFHLISYKSIMKGSCTSKLNFFFYVVRFFRVLQTKTSMMQIRMMQSRSHFARMRETD